MDKHSKVCNWEEMGCLEQNKSPYGDLLVSWNNDCKIMVIISKIRIPRRCLIDIGIWSEQWDSNPQRPPWQGGTLANWAMLANKLNIYKSKKNQEKIEFFPFASRAFFYILSLCLVKNPLQFIDHFSHMSYKILLPEEYL